MKSIKQYSVLIPVMMFVIIVSAGFIKKSDSLPKENADYTHSEKTELMGISEFFYREDNDGRIWHVINLYSQYEKEDTVEYNNSYYSFSKDTVTVINNFKVSGEVDLTALNNN
jgi:hypothetical protein